MDKQLQENLITIAQNQNAIKELGISEGIGLGIKEAATNSKYIEKRVSDSVISLNDVSEVYHKVKVYGDNQEVEVYGKNLLPYPYHETTKTNNGITFTDNGDGTITVNGTATALTNFAFVNNKTFTLPSGTYGFSLTPQVSGSYYLVSGSSATGVAINYANGNRVVTIEGGLTGDIVLQIKSGVTLNNVTFYPQIEAGGISDYEPYTKQTITATPNGTEVDSMCPNMKFFADTDITVDYYISFGMQTEYDRFWDNYQNHGNRRDYGNAFGGDGWTDVTFEPKYDIVVTSGSNLFLSSKITDIVKTLNECGVSFDTSNCSNLTYTMQSMKSKSFPLLDLSATIYATTNLFNNCQNLENIVGIVSSEKTKFHNLSFGSCPKLTHVIFSGIIASDINLQWSPLLDEESLQSLTQTLADFIMVENNPDGTNIQGQPFTKTITLSPESWAILDNLEFIPPEGSGYPTGFSCTTIITTAKGWNRA